MTDELDRHLAMTLHELTRKAKKLGWVPASEAPQNSKIRLLVIEPGSTGVHRGFRDENADFWVTDESHDCFPSNPTYIKVMK